MTTEKTEALVIRLADFSETSRVVTLFSRDWGRISALAKGARRLKGPFESSLDLLCRCRIVFIRKSSGGLDLLTSAELISRFAPAPKSLFDLYGGYYVAELLNGLTEEYDPHPLLFDAAVECLTRLAAGKDARRAIIEWELTVLDEIGQLPDFSGCLACGRGPAEGSLFVYGASHGGMLCRYCRTEEYAAGPIHAGTLTLLDKLTSAEGRKPEQLVISVPQMKEMKLVTTAAISYILGRRPKMLSYLTW